MGAELHISAHARAPEHVDVLILGAGLSGIGAACQLRMREPSRSVAILEARSSIGGTWDLFRYPGIRSDSDMYTLGYSFRPWEGADALADGASILRYVRDTAREHAVEGLVRFDHTALSASWSSRDAVWTVLAEDAGSGEQVLITCDFLWACTGYYRYDEGYCPVFADAECFRGEIVHPQHWPSDLDCRGRRVVVIGSGATAVTLVPALVAQGAAHVTMLQRSPTYVVSVPQQDRLARRLRRTLSPQRAYQLLRWRNVLQMIASFGLSRRAPRMTAALLKALVRRQLPAGYDVERHFSPSYAPWDQRLCMAPDGDLFAAISEDRAAVVTAQIAGFTETGVRLADGEILEADVIVTATGLNLLVLGGMELTVDGEHVELGDALAYKGMMLCGVPNLALTLGYPNASWTLKADLVAEYVCRLLAHMRDNGAKICTPRRPRGQLSRSPVLNLKAGYVLRSLESMPMQGARTPWRLHDNYIRDAMMLRHGPIDDEMDFSAPKPMPAPVEQASAAGEAPAAQAFSGIR